MQAVILAGGRGSRLEPFTRVLPKPLFPIGDEPILSILVRQLQRAGATEIIMCVGYLADLIRAYFQDGSRFGLPIRYALETSPLGTAGPLRNIDGLAEDFLVVNGDELTALDFQALYSYHLDMKAVMTVAVQQKSISTSFGVLQVENGQVIAYREKPTLNFWASMGIYVLQRQMLKYIPENICFDMPDLVQKILSGEARIIGFENQDPWLDIGTWEDWEKAQKAIYGADKENTDVYRLLRKLLEK